MKTSKIILYNEPTVPEIQLEKLQKFLVETFSVEIELRESFFQHSNDNLFKKIESTRVFDLKKPFERQTKVNTNNEMIFYDGFEFEKIISEFIPIDEIKIDILNIIFTNKLTCTFDETDFRYHARALIASNPAIISTSGMIEAPAKPKQYYLDIMTNFSEEDIKKIKEKYKGEFLEYHDSRLAEITAGYLLQAIMYYETGEAFCEQKDCRLFNAHWQKDLFYSQIENKKFCKKHQNILEKIKQR
ncbi:MAG: DUF6775 family putative metallopeptidase [Nitrosopumilus sp.]